MSKRDFAASEFEARQTRVREEMEATGIDLLIVIAPIHINYLIGTPAKGYQEFEALFFPLEPCPLAVMTRLAEVPMMQAESLAEDVRGWGGREPEDPIDVVRAIMEEKGYMDRRVGLEVPLYYLHPYEHQQLVALLGDALVLDATDLIGTLKLTKSPAEIEYVRRAAQILDDAMETCTGAIAEGKTEREVSADVHRTLLAAGSDIPASPMNFLSGPRTAYAHGEPSDRVLRARDFMHIQFGAHYRRYCCTIGRQLCLGEPTAAMQRVYQAAREAGDACVAEMKAGVSAAVPHEAAKRIIVEAGLDEHRLHMTGYALGAAFPPSWIEPLLMESGSPYTLEAGMVIAVEPPLFGVDGELGVRIVDNVLVTETGTERLCRTTRDLIVL